MMSTNCVTGRSVKKDYNMSDLKWQQYEKMKESLLDVERCLPEFDEEEKKDLEIFLSEVKHKVVREIDDALESGEHFGCWLHANHNRMPFILESIQEVRERHYNAPRVRVLKAAVVDALEDLLNAKPRSRFDY